LRIRTTEDAIDITQLILDDHHEQRRRFAMIEQIARVDTTGVAPMTHPLDGAQRLRQDAVEAPPDRDELLRNAPAQEDGLFLVPRVIE